MKLRTSRIATAGAAQPLSAASVKPGASARIVPLVAAAGGPGEVAGLLGVPKGELTPRVQGALVGLVTALCDLRADLARARERIDHLEQLADRDTLTPVLNRRAFVRELSRIMSFAARYGVAGSLLYFDVNGMKQINDRFGHAAGDKVLTHVAETMQVLVRETDVVGRLGGDEFGVILAQADAQVAADKAARLAAAIHANPAVFDGQPLAIRVAYGVHAFSEKEAAEEALDAADRAMYAQKAHLVSPDPCG